MIFIDASFIIAMISEKDQWHSETIKILDEISEEDLITSDLIITETMAIIGKLKGGKTSKTLYSFIKDNYTIYETNLKDLDRGMNTLIKYDGTLSLVDSISINIINELKINQIASFDSDFDKVETIHRLH
ncbi:type II toxin-antitoxin system VapC family toxin [Methanobrevibacter sp. DSM 116169]|uniref:type II toxin-antitoxin system VapC family toxin n=1 Tax=Methanobrevibacter sp. DSM 116169 TaxID=3242727 RepID=UPI0038FD2A05